MSEQIKPTPDTSSELEIKKQNLFEDIEADLFEVGELDGIPHELHKDIALKLIEVGSGFLVAENLSRFAELDQSIALALVKAGFGLEVMNNMDYFDGLDDNIIAEAMLLSGQGGFVRLNPELFPSLTEETLDKLNDRSYQPTPEDRERVFGQVPEIKKQAKLTEEEEKMFKALGCRPAEIAHNKSEINEKTKAYIGEIYPGIFKDLPQTIEHIYTSFPEGKIVQKEITIGGKSVEELKRELEEKGYKISDWAKKMMVSKDFKPAKKVEKLNLVVLSVADLGFPNGATRQDIYDKAQELDLEIVPAEVGPQLRLQYEDQPMGEWLLVGMKPLAASSGTLDVFRVNHNDNGRWLYHYCGHPGNLWTSDGRWVFARK